MDRLIAAIDRINARVAAFAMWLAVAMAVTQLAIVVLRYVFAIGFIALQEAMWTMNGLFFMLGAGYTLARDEHVRIDVFRARASDRSRALVDLFGAALFVLPLAVATVWLSWDYVLNSWWRLEGSRETSGLPVIFLLKTVLWVFAALFGLQGLALAGRAAKALAGGGPYRAAAPEFAGRPGEGP